MPSFVEIGPLVQEKKIFEGFLPYMGMAAILVPSEGGHKKIRAVAGQRSSPDLCFSTKSVKIYDP